jgi:hypothetical protein
LLLKQQKNCIQGNENIDRFSQAMLTRCEVGENTSLLKRDRATPNVVV